MAADMRSRHLLLGIQSHLKPNQMILVQTVTSSTDVRNLTEAQRDRSRDQNSFIVR